MAGGCDVAVEVRRASTGIGDSQSCGAFVGRSGKGGGWADEHGFLCVCAHDKGQLAEKRFYLAHGIPWIRNCWSGTCRVQYMQPLRQYLHAASCITETVVQERGTTIAERKTPV